MRKDTIKNLKILANKTNDLALYKVAIGEEDALTYLEKLLEDHELGDQIVCGEKLSKVIAANKARRKKLVKWCQHETDNRYLENYGDQIALIDTYTELFLVDLLEQIKLDK